MIKKLLTAMFLSFLCTAAIYAQSNVEQAIKDANDQFTNIKTRSVELERMKREAGKRPVDRNTTLAFPEIKEDFEQIQKLDDSILQMFSSKKPTNFAAVSKFAAEINRRALRLKSNLFSPAPENTTEKKDKLSISAESTDLKKLLIALDDSVNSFTHRSIFQNLNLIDSQELLRAQTDLEAIINVSNSVRTTAKKLANGTPSK